MEETYSATVPCLDTNLALQIMENLKALNNKVETLDSTITNRQFQLESIQDIKAPRFEELLMQIRFSATDYCQAIMRMVDDPPCFNCGNPSFF
jgi:hypothetical protein